MIPQIDDEILNTQSTKFFNTILTATKILVFQGEIRGTAAIEK